jgi:hypothetical protein
MPYDAWEGRQDLSGFQRANAEQGKTGNNHGETHGSPLRAVILLQDVYGYNTTCGVKTGAWAVAIDALKETL